MKDHALGRPISRKLAGLAVLISLAVWHLSVAQVGGSGSVEGRISNAATGVYLSGARITVEGTHIETTSEEDGRYRLTGVTPGRAHLRVTYFGLDPKILAVDIPVQGGARQDFNLARSEGPKVDEVVKLGAFTVVVDREMSAQAVAMNEQRNASNIKNVVSLDEYGDRGQENIGEFMRFLPGISIVDSGLTPSTISVRGLPGDTAEVMVDGSLVADAQANNRTVSAQSIPMGNIARVEVTKVPTPDMSASGLGGSVNVISKSGFERSKPLLSYQIYQVINTNSGITLGGGPRGQLPEVSPGASVPSFSASYLRPLGTKLAVSASVSSTWRKRGLNGRDETAEWNLVDFYQRTSLWSHLRSIVKTRAGQAGLDWKITSADTFGVNFQYKVGRVIVPRSQLGVTFGAGATGNTTFTQGAATGVGSVTMGNGSNQATDTTNGIANLRYAHRGDVWEISAGASLSRASRRAEDLTNGHFNNVTSQITNLVVRGEGTGEEGSTIPVRFSAVDRLGARVDIYDGANYAINTLTSNPTDYRTDRSQARLDVRRTFGTMAVKIGAALNQETRDDRAYAITYNFRPNGSVVLADRLAGRFDVFDAAYDAVAIPVNGRRARWISEARLHDLYRQNPAWFVDTPATTHQNQVSNSKKFRETISAAYFRNDLKLLENRLWLVSGARFEATETEGWGPLNDPNSQYVRNAAGGIVRNNAGQPVFLSTDLLERARQRYQERAAHVKRRYDGLYPSVNGTFKITDALLLRAAYARTIGRPNLNLIIPGVTLPESDAPAPRTFTVVNTGLKPWTGDNFDLSLESYQLKNGFGSLGVFQKDIKDFFNLTTLDATPDLAALHGIPPGEVSAGDLISTRENGGKARVRGIEFMYRQSLTFLPSWARGTQVFANATKLQLAGNRAADFGSFTPQTIAWGISLIRNRYSLKFTSTYQGEIRRGLVGVSVANGIPPDTYNYQSKRTRLTLGGEYGFSKHFAVYASMMDIGGLDSANLRYAPGTSDGAKIQRYQELGETLTIGVQGQF
jgi:iron complex outermembrane recepter protein